LAVRRVRDREAKWLKRGISAGCGPCCEAFERKNRKRMESERRSEADLRRRLARLGRRQP
jgi:hypothetical protein